MDFKTVSSKINSLYGYELYLTFFHTFWGCIVSEKNLIGFCNAFNLEINNIK